MKKVIKIINNQKGIILPFTTMVTTIVIFFFLNILDGYMLEQKYYHEIEGMLILDEIIDSTIREVKEIIKNNHIDEKSYTIQFKNGISQVRIVQKEQIKYNIIDVVYNIIMNCTTNNGHNSKISFTYIPTLDKIYNWIHL